jgi:hypothetical protein
LATRDVEGGLRRAPAAGLSRRGCCCGDVAASGRRRGCGGGIAAAGILLPGFGVGRAAGCGGVAVAGVLQRGWRGYCTGGAAAGVLWRGCSDGEAMAGARRLLLRGRFCRGAAAETLRRGCDGAGAAGMLRRGCRYDGRVYAAAVVLGAPRHLLLACFPTTMPGRPSYPEGECLTARRSYICTQTGSMVRAEREGGRARERGRE